VLAAAALAAALTLLTTIGHDLLPPLMYDLREGISANLALVQTVVIAINAVAVAALFRARRSALDFWLLVSLAIWLAQLLLSVVLQSRYSLGFYSMYAMMLVSQLILMLALIAESFRLQMRLALATSARTREREARLMSTDAVTAAISHEIGQPLTSALLSARAGLKWLNRPSPDLEMVDKSLRDTIDSGHRTFAVVKSIRAMFGKGSAPAIEVSLNDLVRETVSLLNRELASGKVSLELELDESLPPVMADRVQIQRVLVNLFINAIESLSATRGQPRRIAIRSVSLDGEDVLLEVSDTGVGVAPEEVEHIFDAFVTTKTTGTGLGLSLCRTIVEEHYGRLWASPGEDCGVTFHLKLPRSGGVPASLQ
jgi:signal transduction histidine kinase